MSLMPFPGFGDFYTHPELAPWAAFWRRFAAKKGGQLSAET
jgi:hypothetical protein